MTDIELIDVNRVLAVLAAIAGLLSVAAAVRLRVLALVDAAPALVNMLTLLAWRMYTLLAVTFGVADRLPPDAEVVIASFESMLTGATVAFYAIALVRGHAALHGLTLRELTRRLWRF